MGQNRGAFIGIECNRYVGGTEQREERQSDGSQHLRETRSREPLAEIVSVKWVEKPCFTT